MKKISKKPLGEIPYGKLPIVCWMQLIRINRSNMSKKSLPVPNRKKKTLRKPRNNWLKRHVRYFIIRIYGICWLTSRKRTSSILIPSVRMLCFRLGGMRRQKKKPRVLLKASSSLLQTTKMKLRLCRFSTISLTANERYLWNRLKNLPKPSRNLHWGWELT